MKTTHLTWLRTLGASAALALTLTVSAFASPLEIKTSQQKLASLAELAAIVDSQSSITTETQDLQLPVQVAERLAKKHGRDQVLVVFDLDNTLLTFKQQLGSVPWFDWQSQNLSNENFKHKVAKDFSGLLNVAGIIYALGEMELTQKDGPALVQRLQKAGIATLILTSRGSEYRNATERELEKNGYNFLATAPGPQGGIAGRYLPYDSQTAATEYYFKNHPFKEARRVTYTEGIYMTSGQNKGLMLSLLLKKLNRNFTQVLFVDDGAKNIQDMVGGTDPAQMRITGFRYGRVDASVERFFKDPSPAIQSWQVLSKSLPQAFPGIQSF